MYFYEDLAYARRLAEKNGSIVIGVIINLKDCLDLVFNKNKRLLKLKYNQLKDEGKEITDALVIDEVSKELKAKSVRYVRVTGNRLYSSSMIYDNVSLIVCVKDIKVIEKWYRLDLSK